jgi:hypothetical protein
MHRRQLIAVSFVAVVWMVSTESSRAITIGGWDAERGGDAAILTGLDFTFVRSDLTHLFPEVTVVATPELTPQFLNTVDVLLLDPVFDVINVQITPLTANEQSALTSWVANGGRALIIAENPSYYAASRSLTEPFGVQWGNQSLPGVHNGTINDHASFPQITNGPYGVVDAFRGGFASFFSDASPASVLGAWNSNGGAAIAAMNYGHGKVVFFGDVALIANYHGSNNTVLRRNALNFLITVPEPSWLRLWTLGAPLLGAMVVRGARR